MEITHSHASATLDTLDTSAKHKSTNVNRTLASIMVIARISLEATDAVACLELLEQTVKLMSTNATVIPAATELRASMESTSTLVSAFQVTLAFIARQTSTSALLIHVRTAVSVLIWLTVSSANVQEVTTTPDV
jgi:hypothetical protein